MYRCVTVMLEYPSSRATSWISSPDLNQRHAHSGSAR